MKIALVNQPMGIIRLPNPGSAISIWNWQVAKRLAAAGNQVVIFTRRGPKQPPIQTAEGVEIRRIDLRRDDLKMKFLRPAIKAFGRIEYDSSHYYRGYAAKVAAYLAAERFDIIHLTNFSQYMPFLCQASPASRFVMHMHCEWLTQSPAEVISRRLKDVDLVVCCSDYITNLTRQGLSHLADRCQTIYNGVDVENFSPGSAGCPQPVDTPQAARANSHSDGAPRVLFVGRISPEKGIHLLIDAFAALAVKFPDLQLDIVGPHWQLPREFIVAVSNDRKVAELERFYPGNYLETLKTMVPPGLSGRVSFPGMVQHTELAGRYRQAAVLVNPSYSESFGVSLIEAMACQVPVVAARVGGMVELVEKSGAGLLSEQGDAGSLRQAIETLLCDRRLCRQFGQAGREFAAAAVSWDRIAERTLSLYGTFCNTTA